MRGRGRENSKKRKKGRGRYGGEKKVELKYKARDSVSKRQKKKRSLTIASKDVFGFQYHIVLLCRGGNPDKTLLGARGWVEWIVRGYDGVLFGESFCLSLLINCWSVATVVHEVNHGVKNKKKIKNLQSEPSVQAPPGLGHLKN